MRPLNFDSPIIDELGDIHTITDYIVENGGDPAETDEKIHAVKDIITDEWDLTHSYIAGDYYIYNNSLYKVIVAGTGFDPTDTDFAEKTSVGDELSEVNSTLTNFGECEILYSTTSATSAHNQTVSDLSQYKYIVIGCYDSGDVYDALTTVPYSLFKLKSKFYASYSPNSNVAFATYVNDTTISVKSMGYGIRIIGIK